MTESCLCPEHCHLQKTVRSTGFCNFMPPLQTGEKAGQKTASSPAKLANRRTSQALQTPSRGHTAECHVLGAIPETQERYRQRPGPSYQTGRPAQGPSPQVTFRPAAAESLGTTRLRGSVSSLRGPDVAFLRRGCLVSMPRAGTAPASPRRRVAEPVCLGHGAPPLGPARATTHV